MTKFQEKVIKLLKKGFAPSEVAKKLNRPLSSVSSVIQYNKDKIGKYKKLNINNCNHNYFDVVDSELKAYLLGFFIADGFLDSKSNRFGITIQKNDESIIKLFNKNICPENNIVYRNRKTEFINRKIQCDLRWSSKNMKSVFVDTYHILPNKTQDINFSFPFYKIDNIYIRHFIRGFIDGDGCFEQNNSTFTITLVSSSKYFLHQIGKYFLNIVPEMELNIKEKKGKTINYFTLRFNMFRKNKPEKVLKIYKYLYEDSNFYLNRKKEKIESYLKYRDKL